MTDAQSEATLASTAPPKGRKLFFNIVGVPATAIALLMGVTILFYPSTPVPVLNLAFQKGCVVEVVPKFGVRLLKIEGRSFCAPNGDRTFPSNEEVRQQIMSAIDARRTTCLKRIEGIPAIIRWAKTVAAPHLTPDDVCGRLAEDYRITGP